MASGAEKSRKQSGHSGSHRDANGIEHSVPGTSRGRLNAETQATTDGVNTHSAVTVKRFMKIVKKAAVEMEKEYERDPDGFEADADPFWPEVDKAMDLWRDEQL